MKALRPWLTAPTSAAPLATFRVVFGAVMLYSTLRFMVRGWVTELYVDPQFYFPYLGFEFVKPLGYWGMHALFILMALAALGIMLGYRYRLSTALFFVAFTYVELIDKTNYLNHYYFVSLVSFWLLWVPAHATFSLDARRKGTQTPQVPRWTVLLLQGQLALVYCYAGVAKLNYDWLVEAMPLRLWLPAQMDTPILGGLLGFTWVAYAFSWFGAFYDLTVAGFLWHPKTRPYAYAVVVAFHVLTRILFPIGVFPWVMMGATLIFFSATWHEGWQNRLRRWWGRPLPQHSGQWSLARPRLASAVLVALISVQVLLPWRYLLYPGNLFWTEEGYRFSWRVMLMEKAGYLTYEVTDSATGRSLEVAPQDYLTPQQVKMVATQPDMILQFAHFLADEYTQQGLTQPQVRAYSYVSLQGRRSRPFIDPTIDLAAQSSGWAHKTWILPASEAHGHAVANRTER